MLQLSTRYESITVSPLDRNLAPIINAWPPKSSTVLSGACKDLAPKRHGVSAGRGLSVTCKPCLLIADTVGLVRLVSSTFWCRNDAACISSHPCGRKRFDQLATQDKRPISAQLSYDGKHVHGIHRTTVFLLSAFLLEVGLSGQCSCVTPRQVSCTFRCGLDMST